METIKLIRPRLGSTTKPLQAYKHKQCSDNEKRSFVSCKPDEMPFTVYEVKPLSEDRSHPRPVIFEWKSPAKKQPNRTYCLTVARDREFTDIHVRRNVSEKSVRVYNLHIGTRYFWKVTARNSKGIISESPVWSFRTSKLPPRWVRVPGITNMRDMGGWILPGNRAIRQGLVYRSSEMNSHVNITEEGRRVLLDELKICTDLDFRGSREMPAPALDVSTVNWVNIPVSGYGGISEDSCKKAYRQAFQIFSNPSCYPIVFHCWGGADRAGTFAFLLHALLGMRLKDNIYDYELTSLSIWGERTRNSADFLALRQALLPFGAHPEDVNGQVENYIRSAVGITEEEVESIRSLLVEKKRY